MIMKNFVASIVWLLNRDVMIVIIFIRNFKNSFDMDLGVSMKKKNTLHPSLENNRSNSLGRLNSFVKNLTHTSQKVDKVCEQEIVEGKKVFYLLHRPIIRESTKTSKNFV